MALMGLTQGKHSASSPRWRLAVGGVNCILQAAGSGDWFCRAPSISRDSSDLSLDEGVMASSGLLGEELLAESVLLTVCLQDTISRFCGLFSLLSGLPITSECSL